MESKLFKCMCDSEGLPVNDAEDVLSVSVWVTQQSSGMSIWNRIKFVFGYWSLYNEILLDKNSVKELVSYCNEWLNTHKNNAL